jgi:hypothetical protein
MEDLERFQHTAASKGNPYCKHVQKAQLHLHAAN